MVLVGDAVHTSGRPDGQGGNLAFEDAAELAAHVRRHGLGQQVRWLFCIIHMPGSAAGFFYLRLTKSAKLVQTASATYYKQGGVCGRRRHGWKFVRV